MATQPPPSRPWFRLASVAPRTAPPAPAPDPAPAPPQAELVPQPRPAFVRPAFRPITQPQEPAPAVVAPPPRPQVHSPTPSSATAPSPSSATTPLPPAFVAPILTRAPTLTLQSPANGVAPAPSPTPAPRTPPTAVATAPSPRSPPTFVAPTPAPRSPPTVVTPAPAPRSPPSAAAPSPPSASAPATPRSTFTYVAPSPPPAAERYPAVTTNLPSLTSSNTRASLPPLLPSSPPPQTSSPTIPSVLSSSSIQQSPKIKGSALSSPSRNPAPASLVSPHQIPTARATTSTSSPKAINPQPNTPSPSPRIRSISHPPSPLTLPPAQLKSDNEHEIMIPQEIEQKTVLVQETKDKPRMSPNSNNASNPRHIVKSHNGKREGTKHAHSKNEGSGKNSSDSEDFKMRVITIAGENKGATMKLSPSMKKYDYGNNHPKNMGTFRTWGEGQKSGSDNSSSSSGGSSEEGRLKTKDKSLNGSEKQSHPMHTFMNSNVQGVNNTVLYNVSCSHHDPGVHLSLNRKANGSCGFEVKTLVRDD